MKLIFTSDYRKGHYCCRIVCALTTLRLFITSRAGVRASRRPVWTYMYKEVTPCCNTNYFRQLCLIFRRNIFRRVKNVTLQWIENKYKRETFKLYSMWHKTRQNIYVTKNIKVLWNIMCFILWNIFSHEDIYNRECHIIININIYINILTFLLWGTTYPFYEKFVNFLWIFMLLYPLLCSAFVYMIVVGIVDCHSNVLVISEQFINELKYHIKIMTYVV